MVATVKPTYAVLATRSDGWWALRVPQLPGVNSQSRTQTKIDHMAREAIALFLGAPPDSFDLVIELVDAADWWGAADQREAPATSR